jgi:carbamoyl-phosphate synthase small subunit
LPESLGKSPVQTLAPTPQDEGGVEAGVELPPALLALEDGSVWAGRGFGAASDMAGELVFNTAITGYQEVLSDPSYRGQIVLMTAPEIGNVGTNPEDLESARPYCAGFVVRELSPRVSNWRAQGTLASLMAAHGVAGIAGIDTRAVTRRIRIGGAQRALITRAVGDPEAAVARARRHPSLEGRDLVLEVTSNEPYEWSEGLWRPPGDTTATPSTRHRVVAYDFGIKRGILRRLRSNGCQVTVVPARTRAAEVLAMKPDGVFLSNGPGDPAAVSYAADAVAEIVRSGTPTFGICLGHQILGLALGGRTYKLKFGHHGANHPVMDLTTRKVEITSQNHGFAVDVGSLEGKAVLTHVNLNDNTVEGMRHDRLPVFSVQYHPEASPGPNDASYLFQRFVKLMDERSRT